MQHRRVEINEWWIEKVVVVEYFKVLSRDKVECDYRRGLDWYWIPTTPNYK
jgi:hypothetical protein